MVGTGPPELVKSKMQRSTWTMILLVQQMPKIYFICYTHVNIHPWRKVLKETPGGLTPSAFVEVVEINMAKGSVKNKSLCLFDSAFTPAGTGGQYAVSVIKPGWAVYKALLIVLSLWP